MSATPICHCNFPAIVKTSAKGNMYWVCPKTRKCDGHYEFLNIKSLSTNQVSQDAAQFPHTNVPRHPNPNGILVSPEPMSFREEIERLMERVAKIEQILLENNISNKNN